MDADGAQIEAHLKEGKLVIVDFYATWCAPCKAYSPKFQRLEREMRRAYPEGRFVFMSVDIDQQQDVARAANVRSVPTTVAYTTRKTIFGRVKRSEALRFSGDRSWNDLLRTFSELIEASLVRRG